MPEKSNPNATNTIKIHNYISNIIITYPSVMKTNVKTYLKNYQFYNRMSNLCRKTSVFILCKVIIYIKTILKISEFEDLRISTIFFIK